MSKRAFSLLAAGIVLGSVVLAGCSSSDDGDGATAATTQAGGPGTGAPNAPAAGVAAAKAGKAEGRTVIDVRTPEEFASGHVEGAVNLNVQDPAFATEIAELDKSGRYLVYCRSGNRSAVATDKMRAIGLDVYDGGGLTDMADAGWPTAQ